MNEGMHWADILAAIYKAGSSPSQIARQERVSPATVTQVIRGTSVSHSVAYAIAAITSIPTEAMWPGVYLDPPAYKQARNGKEQGRLKQVAHA